MQSLNMGLSRLHVAGLALAAFAVTYLLIPAQDALAAADPTTGIDYKTDLADPVLSSAKPAIVAGVAILAIIAAVSLGKKLWGKVSH